MKPTANPFSPVLVSTMTGKLNGMYAINTNPKEIEFCNQMHSTRGTVCEHCYSHRMLETFRKNMAGHLSQNNTILSESVLHPANLPGFSTEIEVFRFNAHGELINENHLQNLINICIKNPHVTFSLWTKRAAMIQHYTGTIPDNLILVFSTPTIDTDPYYVGIPDKFHKVFSVYTKKYAKEHNIAINCTTKGKNGEKIGCMQCLKCYRKNTETHITELLK